MGFGALRGVQIKSWVDDCASERKEFRVEGFLSMGPQPLLSCNHIPKTLKGLGLRVNLPINPEKGFRNLLVPEYPGFQIDTIYPCRTLSRIEPVKTTKTQRKAEN